MYYHPETQQEFATTHDFRMTFANTSFGMLDTEEERNATGLFTVEEEQPESNRNYGFYTNNGVETVDGKYVRKWLFNAYPPEKIRANLMQAVTEKRWQVETAGLTLPNGARVATGTADQNRISNVITNATAAGLTSVDFKAENGWVTLTIEEIRGIATAIAVHVQACFSAERTHHVAIQALSVEELQGYDLTAHWPV